MVCSLVALLVWAPSGSSSTRLGHPAGRIVFTTRIGTSLGTADIFVVNADGSGVRRLTDDRDEEQSPVWSPDGRSIAYAKDTLYRMSADGRKQRVLLPKSRLSTFGIAGIGDLSWSPDGRRIAFTASRLGNAEVWTTKLDGTLQRVTTDFGGDPSWSPDSRRLAYAGLRGIMVVQAGGRRAHRIVNTRRFDGSPLWSPNGKWIALRRYTKRKKRPEVDSLDVVSPSGNARRRILSGGVIFPAAWSPSGDTILFLKFANTLPNTAGQLFLVSLDGGRPRPVAGTLGAIGSASWHR